MAPRRRPSGSTTRGTGRWPRGGGTREPSAGGGTMNRRRTSLRRTLGFALLVTVGVAVALGWGPASRPADAQGIKGATGQPTRLQVIHFSVPPVLVAAKERGFFAAQGLQVENVRTQSSAQLMHGLIDGTYDIACTNAD